VQRTKCALATIGEDRTIRKLHSSVGETLPLYTVDLHKESRSVSCGFSLSQCELTASYL